ncbi:phage tail sheath family protein [Thalassiella azotivora]
MAASYLTPGVYIEEQRSGSMPIEGVGTSVAAFVGFTEKYVPEQGDPTDPLGVKPQLVTNWPQYQRIYGGYVDGAMLPHAVKGFFDNGGSTCFVVRIPTGGTGDDDGGNGVPRPRAALPAAASTERAGLGALHVEAVEPGVDLDVEVVPPPEPQEGQQPSTDYTLRVIDGGGAVQEEITGLSFARSPRNLEKTVRDQSRLVTLTVEAPSGVSLADLVPAPGRYHLESAIVTEAALVATPQAVEGSETDRTGYLGLAIAKDVTMVAIPDLVNIARREDGTVDEDTYLSIQGKLVDWCTMSGTRMAILDTPPGLTATGALDWRTRLARDSAFAALYYPNVVVDNPQYDPSGATDKFVTVTPVGHVAGVWARTDGTRGVWKAPANETVMGIARLETDLTDGEQGLLNPDGVNCLRSFGTNGMRIWGARTLSSTDPSWRYVNVRRLFNYVEESIRRGTQWAVFEPNNEALWQLVKRNITSFLRGLADQGALATQSGFPGFYVLCDESINPPASVDEGKLVVEVGIAPVKPAEFVIFRISQLPTGGEISE